MSKQEVIVWVGGLGVLVVAMTMHLIRSLGRFKNKEIKEPEVGNIVHYYSLQAQRTFPAIVTKTDRLYNRPYRINVVVFRDQQNQFIEGLDHKQFKLYQSEDEKIDKRDFWYWEGQK